MSTKYLTTDEIRIFFLRVVFSSEVFSKFVQQHCISV